MRRMKDEDYEHLMDHSDGRPYADHGAWGVMMILRGVAWMSIVVMCVLLCLGL